MTTRWWELEFQLRPCVERLGARHTDLTVCRGGAIVRGCPTPSCIMGGPERPRTNIDIQIERHAADST
jgi:hypothetical protein